MIYRRGRYSGYIRPFNYLVDLCIVNFLASQFILMPLEYLNYIIFVTIGWLILSLKLRFYDVYRFTRDLVDGRKDPKRKKGIGCIENKWILVLDLRF